MFAIATAPLAMFAAAVCVFLFTAIDLQILLTAFADSLNASATRRLLLSTSTPFTYMTYPTPLRLLLLTSTIAIATSLHIPTQQQHHQQQQQQQHLSTQAPLPSSYVVNTGNPGVCGQEITPAEAFTCLFQNITFSIPNIHVPNIKDHIALDVDNLQCMHLAISLLNIETVAPTSAEHDVLATIRGGTLSCSSDIKLTNIPILKSMSASVNFDISKLQFSVKATMRNENLHHPELPTAATLVVPQSNPTPDLSLKLHLDGSWIIKIINFLGHGLLEDAIKKVILTALSNELPTAINPLLDGIVHNISTLATPYLNAPAPVPLPSGPLPSNVNPIRWDSGLAGSVLGPLSKIMADVSEDNVPLISHFIDFVGLFLGWDSGSILLNLNSIIHIGNDGLSSSTNITINTVKISGLDGLMSGNDELYIFDPHKAMADQQDGNGLQMATKLKFPKLSFDVSGIVSLAPGSIIGQGEGSLKAPATLHVDLVNVSFDLDALIALDWNVLQTLSLGQMLSPSCLLQCLAAFNVTRLDMQSLLDPHSPPKLTFLSRGIDSLMNQLVSVIDGLYATVLSETIRGVVAGPVRDILNSIITKELMNTTGITAKRCLPMPIPSGILPNVTESDSRYTYVKRLLFDKAKKKSGTKKIFSSLSSLLIPSPPPTSPPSLSPTTSFFSSLPTSKAENDVPLNFGSNPIFTLLFGLIDVVLNIDDKPLLYTINDAVNTLTNGTGMFSLYNLLSLDVNFANIHANISLPYVRLHGLNKFTNLDIEASDADILSLEIDSSAMTIDLGVDLSLYITDPDHSDVVVTDARELLELSLVLPNKVRFGSDQVNALIDATALAALDIEHLMSSPGCLGQTVHNLSLNDLILDLSNITIELRCREGNNNSTSTSTSSTIGGINSTSCTAPLHALGLLLDDDIDAQIQLTGLLEKLLKAAVNKTLGQPIVHLLNDLVATFVSESPKICHDANKIKSHLHDASATPSPSTASGGSATTAVPYTGIYPVLSTWLGIMSGVMFVTAIVLGTVMQCRESCQKDRGTGLSSWVTSSGGGTIRTPLLNPTDERGAVEADSTEIAQSVDTAGSAKVSVDHDVALMFHPDVPPYARLSVPFFLLSGALMYLSGNLNIGASVIVDVNFADLNVPLPSLFDFSLGNSIRDMWSAEVYPLALLILLFSGVWPYVKLVMMFTCWVTPPTTRLTYCCRCCSGRVLPVERRGMWLQALDALGKWSLIDTFVLVMMMVAFRFHIQNQLTWDWIKFLPENFLVVDVVVKPSWGIYAFIIATVISLISTHVVIAFHRAAAGSSLDAEDKSSAAVRRFRCVV
jgi:hypothetical protein